MIMKEEVKAQIEIIKGLVEGLKLDNNDYFKHKTDDFKSGYNQSIEDAINGASYFFQELESVIESLKSIQDLQKEAFNAAREMIERPDFDLDKHDPSEMYVRKFKTFDDYFKTSKTE